MKTKPLRGMKIIVTSLIFIQVIFANPGWAAETVNVGLSVFPPFIEKEKEDGTYSGIAVELLHAMNAFQDTYRFVGVSTSASRKQRDFTNGVYDMVPFDDLNWGWQGYPVEASRVILSGDGEVFIALAEAGRGEEYFADFRQKKMVGFRGYHYKFADFNADPDYLKKTFNMLLPTNPQSCIEMILRQRGDIAVVTKSYLLRYLAEHPEARDKLLISQKMDQEYQHTFIIRQGIRPSVAELNDMLDQMEQQGILQRLWQAHGLDKIDGASAK